MSKRRYISYQCDFHTSARVASTKWLEAFAYATNILAEGKYSETSKQGTAQTTSLQIEAQNVLFKFIKSGVHCIVLIGQSKEGWGKDFLGEIESFHLLTFAQPVGITEVEWSTVHGLLVYVHYLAPWFGGTTSLEVEVLLCIICPWSYCSTNS